MTGYAVDLSIQCIFAGRPASTQDRSAMVRAKDFHGPRNLYEIPFNDAAAWWYT